jgi:FAD:protein FMN transferase
MSPSVELRRCRPLLGTFVEIRASGVPAPVLRAALEAAFGAVERVQRRMSFHEAGSDVSRLNREAARRAVQVDPWTHAVLRAARELHAETGGLFDVSVAPRLQRWGYLPETGGAARRAEPVTDQSAIALLPGDRVRFRKPLRVDLGGIAKGFAVDRAVEALRAAGVPAGFVNAGGDLRVFGSSPTTLHVRHPGAPGHVLPLLRIAEGAIATSACYHTRRRRAGRWVSPLVDPLRGRPCLRSASVSVQADTCLAADALTKIVMLVGERSAEILSRHGATGFIVGRSGKVLSMQEPA